MEMEPTELSSDDGRTSSSNSDGDDQNSEQRESTKEPSTQVSSFSDLPEVVPVDTFQGIEVLKNENDYMEVAPGQGKESVYIEHLPETCDAECGKESLPYGVPLDPLAAPNDELPKTSRNQFLNRRVYGIRMRWIILATAALLVLVLVLGIGLGVGLHTSSKLGALSGTRISLVAQPFINGGGSDHSLVMYFQHRTGQIRWMGLDGNGKWTGGDSSTLVAGDAKPGTPISAVSYTWDGATFWRVYYINTANTLQETWSQNTRVGQWALGPLSSMNVFTPLDSEHIGLTACWFGSTSGSDKDYQGSATTTNAKDVEIRLAYAQDVDSFKIMQYIATTQVWTTEQVLSGLDGRASPACHNRQPGTVDYYMFVNQQNAVNVYWMDRGPTSLNTTKHPIGVWTNSSISIPNISSSASLAYENALYAQDLQTQLINGYDVGFDAENSTIQTGSKFETGDEIELPNTGLGVAVQSGSDGGDELLVFCQTAENHIVEYRRPLSKGGNGGWTSSEIKIPYN